MKSGPVNTVEDIRGYRTFIIGRRHWDGKRNGYGRPFQRIPLHFFIRKSLQAFIFWKHLSRKSAPDNKIRNRLIEPCKHSEQKENGGRHPQNEISRDRRTFLISCFAEQPLVFASQNAIEVCSCALLSVPFNSLRFVGSEFRTGIRRYLEGGGGTPRKGCSVAVMRTNKTWCLARCQKREFAMKKKRKKKKIFYI
ncbi:hypothetical protein CDAR_272091 [Caerostris darwini]|uniref:Uncharacterized protein n=1 Tax=Caerostris darwini TaxID=1538125 RepID=A0AAV4W0V8_9ARAC|nr:hypothetical protein CDAR_272091 [Caerostris darwini]